MKNSFLGRTQFLLISAFAVGFNIVFPDDVKALTFIDSWNFNSNNFNSSQGNGTLSSNFVPDNVALFA